MQRPATHADVRLGHQPIMVDTWRETKIEEESPRIATIWRGDWEAFRTDMTAKLLENPLRPEDLTTESAVDVTIAQIEEAFRAVKEVHTKKVTKRGGKDFETPEELESLYKWRRLASREIKRHGRRDRFLRQCMKELVAKLSSLIIDRWEEHNNAKTADQLRCLDPKKNLWPTIKKMSGRSSGLDLDRMKTEDGEPIAKEEVANEFAKNMSSLYSARSPRNPKGKEIVEEFQADMGQAEEEDTRVTVEELLGIKK